MNQKQSMSNNVHVVTSFLFHIILILLYAIIFIISFSIYISRVQLPTEQSSSYSSGRKCPKSNWTLTSTTTRWFPYFGGSANAIRKQRCIPGKELWKNKLINQSQVKNLVTNPSRYNDCTQDFNKYYQYI